MGAECAAKKSVNQKVAIFIHAIVHLFSGLIGIVPEMPTPDGLAQFLPAAVPWRQTAFGLAGGIPDDFTFE